MTQKEMLGNNSLLDNNN